MNTDLKLYALNISAVAFSFTTATDILKIVLLIVSIIYTVIKIWHSLKNNNEG